MDERLPLPSPRRCFFLTALLLAACQPSPTSQGDARQTQELGSRGSPAPASEPLLPAEQRRLKDLLPLRLLACERVSAKSESTGTLGTGVSLAEADYEGASTPAVPRRRLFLRLTDAKGLGSLVGATAALAGTDIDKVTDDGHEKTTDFQGRKAYERYSKSARQGELHVVVADRFLVELAGEELTIEELRAAMRELDVGRLEALRKS